MFLSFQLKTAEQRISWQQSFEIAEAGIEYFKWCLNNNILANCQREKDYYDLSGKKIGKFQVEISENIQCNQTISTKIVSTGFTFKNPEIKRKVAVFYGRESVAKYNFITNSDVWVGSDHIIRGPYHSNGGIRFDGQNLSSVFSSKENWVCTNSFGCGPAGVGYGLGLCPPECQINQQKECVCPGIFSTTQNANDDLFSFPVPPFDFDGLAVNLNEAKTLAQQTGIYLPPSNQINPQGKGWHLIFNSQGNMEARIITNLSPTRAYSIEEDWHYDYFTISQEVFYANYQISSSCGLIFVEDNLWPEGTIKGRITVISANLIEVNKDTDVILNGNLEYTTTSGSDGLTLVAERNVLIGPNSPNDMVLKGIFVAQKGRFSRNHYPQNLKNSLTIFGSIVSRGRIGTQWILTPGGNISSGYLHREIYPDRNLIYNPPIFTPFLSPQFKIVNWEEI